MRVEPLRRPVGRRNSCVGDERATDPSPWSEGSWRRLPPPRRPYSVDAPQTKAEVHPLWAGSLTVAQSSVNPERVFVPAPLRLLGRLEALARGLEQQSRRRAGDVERLDRARTRQGDETVAARRHPWPHALPLRPQDEDRRPGQIDVPGRLPTPCRRPRSPQPPGARGS